MKKFSLLSAVSVLNSIFIAQLLVASSSSSEHLDYNNPPEVYLGFDETSSYDNGSGYSDFENLQESAISKDSSGNIAINFDGNDCVIYGPKLVVDRIDAMIQNKDTPNSIVFAIEAKTQKGSRSPDNNNPIANMLGTEDPPKNLDVEHRVCEVTIVDSSEKTKDADPAQLAPHTTKTKKNLQKKKTNKQKQYTRGGLHRDDRDTGSVQKSFWCFGGSDDDPNKKPKFCVIL